MLEVRNLTIAQGGTPPLAGVVADGESGGSGSVSLRLAVMARPRWGGYWRVGNRLGPAGSSCWMGCRCLNR